MAKKNTQPDQIPVSRLPAASLLSWEERYETGRKQREVAPRSAHAEWNPPAERDMLALLEASNQARVESLPRFAMDGCWLRRLRFTAAPPP